MVKLIWLDECVFYWRDKAKILYEYEGDLSLRFHIVERAIALTKVSPKTKESP